MSQPRTCWCGNVELEDYSPQYRYCPRCQTLVSTHRAAQDFPRVQDDEKDFYGRQYWFKHQEQDLGLTNIEKRARTDVTERCQHWLRELLRYRLPPAKILELGCAHGGFVAMTRAVGFDATGLELSPWVVDFAKRTFDVPMLLGPIEQQSIQPASLDVIIMMDVLEHLADPATTLRTCARLLKPDGVLVAQTPCFPVGRSHEQLLNARDPILEMFVPDEHLFLFSQTSAKRILADVGLGHVTFEQAMFGHYDMFLFASSSEIARRSDKQLEEMLLQSPDGRLALLWLDLDRRNHESAATIAQLEQDRANRLDQVKILTAQIKRLQAYIEKVEPDRASRLEQINTLTAQLATLQAAKSPAKSRELRDKVAQLRIEIHTSSQHAQELQAQIKTLNQHAGQLQAELQRSQADRLHFEQQIQILTNRISQLQNELEKSDADRAERLKQIYALTGLVYELQSKIEQIELDRASRLEKIHALTAQIAALEARPAAEDHMTQKAGS